MSMFLARVPLSIVQIEHEFQQPWEKVGLLIIIAGMAAMILWALWRMFQNRND